MYKFNFEFNHHLHTSVSSLIAALMHRELHVQVYSLFNLNYLYDKLVYILLCIAPLPMQVTGMQTFGCHGHIL